MFRVLFILLLVSISFQVNAQLFIGNFIGGDSKTVNGTWNYEVPFGVPIPVKKFNKNHKIIVHPSYTLSQTFLNDKWIFNSNGDNTTIALDDDPSHTYKKSIFSYQSKIRSWSWRLGVGFQSKFGKLTADVFYVPSYIQVGSFRRRYEKENEVIKVKERFRDKADYYNINRFQHRVKASLTYWGLGIGGYLNLTPYFKKSTTIDLQKFGLTIVIRNEFWTNLLDFDDVEDEKERSNPDVKQMMF